MKKLHWIDKEIKKIIELFEYDMNVVRVDSKIDCTCKDFTTKQGDPRHKLCLGTGQKIKIMKIMGVSQEIYSSFMNQGNSDMGLSNIYYFKSNNSLTEGDIIVDKGNISIVQGIERKKGTHGDYVYQKCLCINKRTDVQIFLKNFNEVVKR
ncbi:hypothetical protein [Lysinibacillus pakistanensis]|uniref:hypothetical protein n=1 Tax=Lysinibacillus pakistanensis TaxID=759811 RepID=UPI003D27C0D8